MSSIIEAIVTEEVVSVGEYKVFLSSKRYSVMKGKRQIVEILIVPNQYTHVSLPISEKEEISFVTRGEGQHGFSILADFHIEWVDLNDEGEVVFAKILYKKNFNEVV